MYDVQATGAVVTCVVCSPRKTDSGSPFTHWGQNNCPASADFVYTGFAVCTNLCFPLTANVRYNVLMPYLRPIGMYTRKPSLSCAVCLTRKSRSALMVPDQCPENWMPEYTGILMGIYTTGQEICVAQPAKEVPNILATNIILKLFILIKRSNDAAQITACSVCSPPPKSVVFTRWGKTSCPKGSVTKYSGVVLALRLGFYCERED